MTRVSKRERNMSRFGNPIAKNLNINRPKTHKNEKSSPRKRMNPKDIDENFDEDEYFFHKGGRQI